MIPFYLLFLLVSFGSVSAVLCTPALPAMKDFFGISVGSTQLIVTSYLAGYALGQLPYGPLANKMGRKKALYIGISLSIFGSFLCVASSSFGSFSLLLAARFIQALGACVGLKVSFTMVLDVYDSATATKLIARFLAAFAIMPGIAAAIGGGLVQWMSWESCFYFLALFGVVMLLLIARLPETARVLDPKAFCFKAMVSNYGVKFKNRRLLLCGFLAGSGTGIIYLFTAKAPFIGIELMGMRPDVFGLLNCIPSFGMLLGSFSTAWMMKRFVPFSFLRLSLFAGFGLSCAMVFFFAVFGPMVGSLFILTSLIYVVEAWIFTMGSSLGLTNASNKSNASAVFNFLNIGSALIAVLLSQWIYPEASIMLPLVMVFLFFAMILFYLGLKRLKPIV